MLSIIVYGRNDNHGYNLHKRAAVSINCLAEMLRDPADELIFVDYNSPDDLPTFPEAIRDTLTWRCYAFCGSDPRFTAGLSNAPTSRCWNRWPGTSASVPPTRQIAGYFRPTPTSFWYPGRCPASPNWLPSCHPASTTPRASKFPKAFGRRLTSRSHPHDRGRSRARRLGAPQRSGLRLRPDPLRRTGRFPVGRAVGSA